MKVRCALREVPYDLLKDKVYETYQDTETNYRILNEFKTFKYYRKEDFVEVKEDKVMKIRQWEELAGKVINGYTIAVDAICDEMDVRKNFQNCIRIYYARLSTEQIITQLKPFGIEVQFDKEPTITQNDYNWLVAMKLKPNWRIQRNYTKSNIICNLDELHHTSHILSSLELDTPYLVSDLLKMKVEN
jgi:hypothetical protein